MTGSEPVFLDDRERVLEALERIVRSIQSTLDLNEILDTLAVEVMQVGLFQSLMVALVDNDQHTVVVRRRINKWMIRDGVPFSRDTTVYPLDDSNITPRVVRTGKMTVFDGWDDAFLSDTHDNKDQHRKDPSRFEGRTFYFIPLKVKGKVTAVLATASPTEQKQDILSRISDLQPLLDQIALVLQHALLHEKSLEHAAHIESHQRVVHAMHEIGRTILSRPDLDEALDTLVTQVAQSGLFRSVMVALVNEGEDTITVVRQLGRPAREAWRQVTEEDFERTDTTMEIGRAGVVGDVVRTGSTEIIEGWDDRFDIEGTHERLRNPDGYKDKVSYFIPVKNGEKVVAVLATGSRIADRANTEARIAAIGPLLDQVAVAISHATLYRQMREARAEAEAHARRLAAFYTIGRAVLSARELDDVIETLMVQVAENGIFRSLTFLLVDREDNILRLMRTMRRDREGDSEYRIDAPIEQPPEISLDSEDISAVVAREGERLIIEGWDDRFQSAEEGSFLLDRANYVDKMSYFIPIKRDDEVIAVLATGSKIAERRDIEHRLDEMAPLFDQVAVAISHAQMVDRLSRETERLDSRIAASERENLALLGISARIQEITRVEDLEDVLREIHQELLEYPIDVCGLTIRRILHEEEHLVEQYHLCPDGSYEQYVGQDVRAIDGWRRGQTQVWNRVAEDAEGLPDRYYAQAYSRFGVKVESLINIPYSDGVIALRSSRPDAFTDEGIEFLRRIFAAVSVGIARIADLERIDRSARFETTLLGISQLCSSITTSDALDRVLPGTWEALSKADVDVDGLVLHRRVDADRATYQSWYMGRKGLRRRTANKPNLHEQSSGRTRMREDLKADLEDLNASYPRVARDRYGVDIRSTLEIPFGHGIFAVVSRNPRAYRKDEIQFFERVAEILGLGVARVTDLENLEQRNREQVALLTVNRAVADTSDSTALPSIMRVVLSQMLERGIPLAGVSLHTLLDEQTTTYESTRIKRDGTDSYVREHSPEWYRHWDRDDTLYCEDLTKDTHAFPDDFCEALRRVWDMDVRSILVVPHTRGVFTLPAVDAHAFSKDDIALARRIAQIISVGMARLKDLKDLESRAGELAREKDFSNRLIESMVEGFAVYAPDGRHIDANPALCRLTGFAREELIGTAPPYPYWPEEHHDDLHQALDRMRDGQFTDYELTFVRKDGERFPATVTPAAVYDEDGETVSYVATIRDASIGKQLEAERIQTQRLRAAGELSAGISHNLNNILTGVIGPAQLLQMKSSDPDVLTHVDAILTSARRASDIVQQLYRGTTQQNQSLERVNLNRVVEEAIQAAAPRWKDEAQARGIQIAVTFEDGDIPDIRGTQAQMHDIILNLLFNAVDALPTGGRISLETRSEGGRAVLRLRDDGMGMNEETRARIFEPFFTTKMDVGTGLGLATVYNTIARWDGSIDVTSSPGNGTTFTLRLMPWVGETEEVSPTETTSGEQVEGRVLIVDDDDFVADFLMQVLDESHTVFRTRTGAEALELENLEAYDLAVIDLGLTGLPGDQVGARIRDRVHGIATILISGWDLDPSDNRLRGFDNYLRKPFTNVRDIRRAVAEHIQIGRERRSR